MEEDKDREVAGRAPGPGIPEYLRKGIIACTTAPSRYPWCLRHDYHCSLGKKEGGEDKYSLFLIGVRG